MPVSGSRRHGNVERRSLSRGGEKVLRTTALRKDVAMNRREFLLCGSATSTAMTVQRIFGAQPRYKIGIDANSRSSNPETTWGGDPFRGFREAHEVGYTYMEVFATNVSQYFPNDVDGLKK